MFADFLKEKGYNSHMVAKGSGIPYTTVNELKLGKKQLESCSLRTVAALAEYFKMPVDTFIRKVSGTGPLVVTPTWEDTKDKVYIFPVIEKTDAFDISRVHPLKQKEVIDVYNAVKDDDRIESIELFGSGTGIRCCRVSDVDFCVKLKEGFVTSEAKNEISEKIQEACGYDADILWADRITPGSTIDINIKKGVMIIGGKNI